MYYWEVYSELPIVGVKTASSQRVMTIDDDDGRCWCECKQNILTAKTMMEMLNDDDEWRMTMLNDDDGDVEWRCWMTNDDDDDGGGGDNDDDDDDDEEEYL